jgi:hypothetical protein
MNKDAVRVTVGWLIVTFLLQGTPSLRAQEQAPPAPRPQMTDSVACTSPESTNPPAPAPPAPTHQMPVIPPGPLGEVDRSFVNSYTAREDLVLAHQPPYVVVSGSELILHQHNSTTRVRVIPNSYHALKDIAHIPFTVYLLLSPVERNLVTLDAQMPALTRLSACVDAALSTVTPEFFSADQLDRQRTILRTSAEFIKATLQSKTVRRDDLLSFARKMGPLMLQNADQAGCAQIQGTHAQMMKWKEQMTQDEWSNLMVVNLARHQARYRNAATQYFHWLIGDNGTPWSYPGESMRVIFAESLGPSDKASNELAIVEIDADASEAFFGNPWRLSEDILSDGADRCIRALPVEDRAYSKSSK